MFNNFYRGKHVLVTGHTGFKGGWLSLWLKSLGATISGISLPPPTHPNLHEIIKSHAFGGEIECDIRNLDALASEVKKAQPDVVFHLAAQPIVRRSYSEPLETFETNAVGTANVLEAVRRAELPCSVIVITSDKCYENREWEFAYRENDPLGGHDIYSMSKAASELVAQAWNRSFFIPNPKLGPVATVRAGNVIGGGDYAQDRIVPDCSSRQALATRLGMSQRLSLARCAAQPGTKNLSSCRRIQFRSRSFLASVRAQVGRRNPEGLARRMGGRLGPKERARGHLVDLIHRASRSVIGVVPLLGF